jgi:hypothetical protein
MVHAGSLDITRHSLSPDAVEAEITAPSGDVSKVRLEPDKTGRATASVPATEMGLYRVSDGTHTALAAAGPVNPREFEDVRASAEPLGKLVDESGGAVVRLATSDLPQIRKVGKTRDKHGRNWIGLNANEEYVVTGVDQMPLLPAIVVLALVLGTSLFAWYREGR